MLWASLYWKSLYSLQDFELKDCSIGVSFLTGYHKEDGADWPKVLWDASRFGLKMPLSEAFKRAFLKSSDGIFHWRRKLLPNMLRVRTLNELQANFERTLSQSSEPKFKKVRWNDTKFTVLQAIKRRCKNKRLPFHSRTVPEVSLPDGEA